MLILLFLSIPMIGYMGIGLLSWLCTGERKEFTDMVQAGLFTCGLAGGIALIVAACRGGL